MALPGNVLSSSPVKAEFLQPDASGRKSKTEDFERGGVALNDVSQGMNVQDWRVRIVGTTMRLGVYPDGVESDLFLAAEVSEVSLAFDQLMRPAVAYMQAGIAKLYWYDTALSAQSTLTIGAVRTPFLCLDDKRATQSSTSDILLFYLTGTELRYRQQRDRFTIERTLATGLDGGSFITRCGMGTNLRLHIEISGAGKLQPRRGFILTQEQGLDGFAAAAISS